MNKLISVFIFLLLSTNLAATQQVGVAIAPYAQTSVLFTGGPIATLNSGTGGSGLVNGTYNGLSLSGGSGTGATANIVVSGCPGACVITPTIVSGGAVVTNNVGATGYLKSDTVTVAGSSLGGSGTVSFTPATFSSYAWSVPANARLMLTDACGGGQGGAGGEASDTGGAGGGGGAAPCTVGYPLNVTPGSTLTITVGQMSLGAAAGVAGSTAGTTTITGSNTFFPTLQSLSVAPGTGAAGAGGGGGNSVFGGAQGVPTTCVAGAAGTTTTAGGNGAAINGTTWGSPVYLVAGGCGGGGGGSNGATGKNGGTGTQSTTQGYAAGGTASGAAAGGGGGAASAWGQGAAGGTGGAGHAGTSCSVGFGGGGGGGASNGTGGNGCAGFVLLRF